MKLENIKSFLINRNWRQDGSFGQNFDRFYSPQELNLSSNFYLEIPKIGGKSGFQRYAQGIAEILSEIYLESMTVEDIRHIFSHNESVFSLGIADFDTVNGTIRLDRYRQSIDCLFKVIKNAVIFVATGQPIFGNAKIEVAGYINACRILQTAKGSYVTKLELPFKQLNLFSEGSVPDKLIEVIEFVNINVVNTPLNSIDSNYVLANKEYINIELLTSIKNLFKSAEIRDADFTLLTQKSFKKISSRRINEKLNHLEKFIKIVKDILLEEIPLEIIGTIFRLNSKDTQRGGTIWVETEIAEEKEIVEVILNSDMYLEAVEAHKTENRVRIKGLAKQRRDTYFIGDVEVFVVG